MISRMHEPLCRTDWALCDDAGGAWSSTKVGDCTPADWYGWMDGGRVLLLKDTRKNTFFSNRLEAGGHTFLYQLPAPRPTSHLVLQRLHAEADAADKSVEVRLFSVECALNFYLGEWVVTAIVQEGGRTYAKLRRLRVQDGAVCAAYAKTLRPKRSRSEATHADAIAALLPDGWKVCHEPECVSFSESELVVDGVMRQWGGDQYVCDYVAAKGSRRVCFESKSSEAGFDEVAKLKCRALRDKSCTRVVALVDHGDWFAWHDFGCPAARVESTGRDVEALRRLLEAA